MSDKLLIEKGQLVLTTEEGSKIKMPEEKLSEMIRGEIEPPINGDAFPDGVKFIEWKSPFLCVVHQLPPHVRQARWIEDDSPVPFGPETKWKLRRLSFPYAVMFMVFYKSGGQLSLIGYNELYFRNEPLRSKQDKLGYPALLNVSKIDIENRSRAWICTQHLNCPPKSSWTSQVSALLDHTWNGTFNRSSEMHEGASWYSESADVHEDLHPIPKWEEASKQNDAFALSVPWKPVKLNVGQLIDAMLNECRANMTGSMFARRTRTKSASRSIIARLLSFNQQETTKSKK